MAIGEADGYLLSRQLFCQTRDRDKDSHEQVPVRHGSHRGKPQLELPFGGSEQ